MCGRYFQHRSSGEIARYARAVNAPPNLVPSFNRAPTQDGLVLRRHPDTGARHLDALRWGLIITGFVGVLLVVQPQIDGFNGHAWLCVLGTFLHAVRDLITRRIPAGIPSALITQTNAIAAMALGGVLCLGQTWQPVDGMAAVSLGLAALCLCMAYSLMVRATRQSELSVVAPFRYTGLLYALLGGYWVWGEVPNAWAWSGIALLVTSGLVMLQRERLRSEGYVYLKGALDAQRVRAAGVLGDDLGDRPGAGAGPVRGGNRRRSAKHYRLVHPKIGDDGVVGVAQGTVNQQQWPAA